MVGSLRVVIVQRVIKSLRWIRRPEFLVFLPAITLAGFWLGGEKILILLALGLPLIFAVAADGRTAQAVQPPADEETSVSRAISLMDSAFSQMPDNGRSTGCLVLEFDDLHLILERHGRAAQAEVVARVAERLRFGLRVGDVVAHLEGGSLAIVLTPVRRLDLEALVQLAARLQEITTEPVPLGGAQVFVSCSIGFCVGERSPSPDGRALLDAAQLAAYEARRHGPGAIRAWSEDMAEQNAARLALRDDIENAIDRGEIQPFFQPQISTDTGEISGLEALARWMHPERGQVNPDEFLPLIDACDMYERLGETMLSQSLSALAQWDKEGLRVPSVSVNFSASELRNPRLPDKIAWELDRHGMQPDRLTIEILETVIAETENDTVVSNIAQLAKMGCGVDLDDFGTGHASITTLNRFEVRRLKIDRSFLTQVDTDRHQQRMVSAIISMAERLGLETLGEGVETAGEHAMLSQLGCGHVQGYGLARPMPLTDTTEWIRRHMARPDRIPRIGQRGR